MEEDWIRKYEQKREYVGKFVDEYYEDPKKSRALSDLSKEYFESLKKIEDKKQKK